MYNHRKSDFQLECMHAQLLSRVRLCDPWNVAHQASLSMRLSQQEYWSALPFPSPGDLPHSGVESEPPKASALAGGLFTTEPPRKPLQLEYKAVKPPPDADVELIDDWLNSRPFPHLLSCRNRNFLLGK